MFSLCFDAVESRYFLLLAILAFSSVVYRILSAKQNKPLPPGPPQRFIGGNYHMLPKQQQYLTYTAWAKVYGPIYHLRIFNSTLIVLNDAKSALDLLESRASIYSDRPHSVMRHDIAKRDGSIFSMHYSDPRFRKFRKLLHSGLNPRAVKSYEGIQRKEVDELLRGLEESPGEFISHLRRNAGALILKVTYGYEVSNDNDDFVKKIEETIIWGAKKLNQPFIVEFFPILRFLPSWFPFVQFKKVARELERLAPENPPFEWAKKIMASGTYVESFTSRLLHPEDGPIPDSEEEEMIKWCSAALYFGGADTTVSAMTSFFRLMMLYPSVQARAQKDIDLVTGKERLPSLEDQSALPYITALIKEVIRWAPVAPLGVRHRVIEEDVYEGYRIPKGSTIIGNIWAITHDPNLYPNPDVFDPERHMGDNPQADPFKFVFGFGRRVCPGAYFAEQSLFLSLSNVLAAFNLQSEGPAMSKDGVSVSPTDLEWFGSTTNHMKPFPCLITPRAPQLLASIIPAV